jgi:ketosteroid isomerase-like protein
MSTEERLQLLEDERAILYALHTYGHGLDYGLEDEYRDIWTEDAVLAWPERPPFEGREAIMAAFKVHTHAPDVFHKHFMVDPRIVVDGDRATNDCYFARLDNYPGGPEIKSFGRYRDVFVRCDDGKWRFKERRNERESGRPPAVEHP